MAATLELARAEFGAKLAEAGITGDAKTLIEIARPAFIFRPAASAIESDPSRINRPEGATNEDDIPVGASKIGGRPDLPAGFSWPGTQSFVLQLDLSKLPPEVIDLDLPREGLLLFFADAQEPTNGTLAWIEPFHTRLQRTEPPEGATLFLPRRMTRDITLTLDLNRPEVPATDLREDDVYTALALPDAAECIQLGGDAQTLNDDKTLHCEDEAADPPDGIPEEDLQWRLVLRVGAIEECEMNWGDSLFVFMRAGDLKARRFDNAVVLQLPE